MVAEHWNGTAWTMETIPSPPGEASALYSISCTAATACTAVGLEASEGLVERWNGIAWSRQALPALKEGEERRLESVSCVSATSCMAVGVKVETHKPGETFPPPPNSAVAESWNGTTWTQEEPAIPVAVPSEIGHESYFYGVSCTSATACTATGRFVRQLEESPPAKRAEDVSLAEEWNGTTWTAAETPNPAGGVNESLIGVSCVAEAECLSVGEFGNTTEKSREALAEVDPPEAELAEIKQREKVVAERRLHEAEASKKAAGEREAAARKAREEAEAAVRTKHAEELASLGTTEQKAAAESRFHEEEAATKKAGEESEAAARKAREEAEAATMRSREEGFMTVGSGFPAATSAMAPSGAPVVSLVQGGSPSKAKALTETQKVKACRRLVKKKRIACEARVRKSYSAGRHKSGKK